MRIEYKTEKLQKICTDLKAANNHFGGDKSLAISLLARITALESAICIKDIIVQPQMHFHTLKGNRTGLFAMDVRRRSDPWRIILEPIKEDGGVFTPCHIDEIASIVRVVSIGEVSKHYE